MNQKFARQAIALCALGAAVCIVLLVATMAVSGQKLTDTAIPVESSQKDPERTKVDSTNWLAHARDKEYSVIEKRRLFETNVFSQPKGKAPALTEVDTILSQREGTPSGPSYVASEGPSKDRLAVVGVVVMNGSKMAVVEDLEQGETRFVSVDGEFKGYRLIAVSDAGATWMKNGRRYEVAIGENKPEAVTDRPLTREALQYMTEERRVLFRHQVPGLSTEERQRLLE